MSEANEVREIWVDDRRKRILIYAGVLAFVFLLGLVPMWLTARSRAVARDNARRELRMCSIQASLASAAIDARLGNYEPARVAASSFFTDLLAELNKGSESVFDQSKHENLKSLLIPRDELITLLARSDPAAADRLANLVEAFRKSLGTAAAQR